jgi:hypothetical protein
MGKPDFLLDHLLDPRFQDRRSPIFLPGDAENRLFLRRFNMSGGWRRVANFIASPLGHTTTWFPDTNVAIRPETELFWDAVRASALGSQRPAAVLSGVVEAELEEWLDDPWRAKERADMIRSGLAVGSYRIRPKSTVGRALLAYAHLLGFRRLLARPSPDGKTLLGTNPADKSRTMDAIKKHLGSRALGLAKKGRQEAESKGVVKLSDELHCMMAIAHALTNRRHTLILTADRDYMEIFFKAQWFLDTHYRAWLASKAVKDGAYGSPVRRLEDTKGYFDGPVLLYRRVSYNMREVLPRLYEPVEAGVVYMEPDGTLQTVTFAFEAPMLGMIETRGKTDGRCTDELGDANLHIDLGPFNPSLDGLHLGVGKDVFDLQGSKSPCGPFRLARLDLEHSVCCFERSAW